MRDIGDGDKERPPTLLAWRGVDGIVKIFRVFTINSDKRQVAQIKTCLKLLCRHIFGETPGLFLHGRWPLKWNIKTAQRNIDLNPRRANITKYLTDRRYRLAPIGWVFLDLGNYILAVTGPLVCTVRNYDLVWYALAVRHHDTETRFVVVTPDDFLEAALKNLDDRAFLAPAIINPGNPRHDTITIKQPRHLLGTQIKVVATGFRREKPIAILHANDLTRQQSHVGRQSISSLAVTNQLPIPTHGNQAPPQCLQLLVITQLQQHKQLIQLNRLTRLL